MAGENIKPIYDTQVLRKGGRPVDVEFNAGISLYQGKPADFVIVRDITERKNAERELFYTQNKLATLLSNLPGMAYRCTNDKNWTMEYISEGCLELTGYPAEDFLGNTKRSFNDIIHPNDRDFVWESVQTALKYSRPFRMEYRIIAADGREKWVWEQGRAVDGEGDIHFEGFITDITDKVKSNLALTESEERFRNLFNNSVLGIYQTTPEGRILVANPALIKMLGYDSFAELAERNLENDKFYDSPLGRDSFKKKIESAGKVSGFEAVWKTKNSGRIFVRENAKLVRDPNGKPLFYEGTVEDITASKVAEKKQIESETKYRALFEQATDAVFIEDTTGIILDTNSRATEILGWSREELIGSHISKLVPPEESSKLRIHFERLEHGVGFRVESYNLHKDGRKIPVEVNIMPVEVSGESLIIVFVRDISDKRRLEDQLRLSQKLEALGRLSGGIAHDFNNLLTGIFGFVDILKLSLPTTDPNYSTVEDIESVAVRAASLTKRLLAFSRKQVLRPEALEINEVIGDMSGILARIIGEKIDFRFEPGENLPLIMVDRSQLEQVLMNLVINAGDAMPDGGRLIVETAIADFDKEFVETHSEASFGKHVMLAVSDTGCGISAENLPRIFEPFFTTKGAGVGTGLGLPTVYGIVKQSGGHVFVYSEIDKGTTFKVYFPIAEQDTNEKPVPNDLPCDGDETILVVDDDPDVRKAIVKALSYNGYNVVEASDGREALEKIGDLKGPLHLVITDIVMPKLGGRDLVEIIRDIYPAIKIIYISGYTDKSVIAPELESAPGEFFAKPFSSEALAKKVREILDS